MIETLKTYSLLIIICMTLVAASNFLGSGFLLDFLTKDLITLLVALLAINTTTISVIMSKLREVAKAESVDFSSTIHELRISIAEQVGYIVAAIILLIVHDSSRITSLHPFVEPTLEIGLLTIFMAALRNLQDTATAVFILLDHENGSKD